MILQLPDSDPRQVAILGAGDRGVCWAMRFLSAGWDVALFDADPAAGMVARARIGTPPSTAQGRLRIAPLISDSVAGALWIGDCTPNRLALKRKLYQKVQEHCRADAVIAATCTGFAVDDLQSCATRPGQILAVDAALAVERPATITIVPGKFSTAADLKRARAILSAIGLSARLDPTDARTAPPGV